MLINTCPPGPVVYAYRDAMYYSLFLNYIVVSFKSYVQAVDMLMA